MKRKSMATVELECSNPYSTPVFEDFVNEIQRRFDVEKNSKNRAYAFITEMGLIDEFKDFSSHYKGIDHHGACVDMLQA